MKVEFEKIANKDDFIIMIIPTIAFGKQDTGWFIGCTWLCFAIQINF